MEVSALINSLQATGTKHTNKSNSTVAIFLQHSDNLYFMVVRFYGSTVMWFYGCVVLRFYGCAEVTVSLFKPPHNRKTS